MQTMTCITPIRCRVKANHVSNSSTYVSSIFFSFFFITMIKIPSLYSVYSLVSCVTHCTLFVHVRSEAPLIEIPDVTKSPQSVTSASTRQPPSPKSNSCWRRVGCAPAPRAVRCNDFSSSEPDSVGCLARIRLGVASAPVPLIPDFSPGKIRNFPPVTSSIIWRAY